MDNKPDVKINPDDEVSFGVVRALSEWIKEGKITADDAVSFVVSVDDTVGRIRIGETITVKGEDYLWLEVLRS